MKVGLTGTLRTAADGAASVDIEARTIRELLNLLLQKFPALEKEMETGIAVSIDGEIYRDTWSKEIPEGSEVFLLPRIAGG